MATLVKGDRAALTGLGLGHVCVSTPLVFGVGLKRTLPCAAWGSGGELLRVLSCVQARMGAVSAFSQGVVRTHAFQCRCAQDSNDRAVLCVWHPWRLRESLTQSHPCLRAQVHGAWGLRREPLLQQWG